MPRFHAVGLLITVDSCHWKCRKKVKMFVSDYREAIVRGLISTAATNQTVESVLKYGRRLAFRVIVLLCLFFFLLRTSRFTVNKVIHSF